MKRNIKKLTTLILAVSFFASAQAATLKGGGYTSKDATTAINAFHKTFYNPEMKLYAISSDMKGRAAIWV